MSNFANQQVWLAQRCSRNVKKSVWEPTFLHAAIDILRDGWWREYPHEVWQRICKFESLKDFLTSEDGLGWPDVAATCSMIQTVAESKAATEIRWNAGTTLRDLALQLLAELEKHGIDKWAAELEKVEADPLNPHGVRKQAQERDEESGLFAAIEEAAQNPLNPHGGHKPNGDQPRVDIINSRTEGGTGRHYLIQRLARDFPHMLNEIGSGKKYRSARAAAIAAGIVKDVPTVRLTEPSRIAEALWTKLSREELAMLVAALTERLTSAD